MLRMCIVNSTVTWRLGVCVVKHERYVNVRLPAQCPASFVILYYKVHNVQACRGSCVSEVAQPH